MTFNLNAIARFTQVNIDRLPADVYGVYGLFLCNSHTKVTSCLYVGMAKDQPLKIRLLQHFNKCHNPQLREWLEAYPKKIYFVTETIVDNGLIEKVEEKYICLYFPRTNKQR